MSKYLTMKPKKNNYSIDEEVNHLVHEPSVTYGNSVPTQKIHWLEFVANPVLISKAISIGISFNFFNLVKNFSPFSDIEWSGLLGVSLKTMQRQKKNKGKLNSSLSERVIEVAEVVKYGHEVFDSPEKFKLWVNSPTYALGGNKPIELLKNSYGKELVMRELHAINYGVFA